MAGGKEPGATKVSIEQVLGALASKRGERAVPPSPDRVGGAAGEHRTAQLRALRQPIEMSRLETERIGLRRPNGREHERGGARRVVAPTTRHPTPAAPGASRSKCPASKRSESGCAARMAASTSVAARVGS